MKFLKHTVWSLIVASMMTACMGFDEINVDPDKTNRPTPGMLATQVLFSMMDSRSNSSEGFANHCMLSKHIACGEKIRDYAYNRIGRTGLRRLYVAHRSGKNGRMRCRGREAGLPRSGAFRPGLQPFLSYDARRRHSLFGSSGRRERQLHAPLRYAEGCDRGGARRVGRGL